MFGGYGQETEMHRRPSRTFPELYFKGETIGLYRQNAIAIESEANDPFGGNVYYVTMQITLHIPEFARKERNM